MNPIFEVEYASLKAHRHQSRIFELPLPIKVQKLGFQDQEDGTILETEERNVRFWYVSTTDFGSVTYSQSTNRQRNYIVIKVVLFEHPLPIKTQIFGFQDQEDGVKLECE